MICYGMLTIDFLALMVWMFVFKPYAGDVKLFAGGMGLAIFTAMIHKIIKYYDLHKKDLKLEVD